MAANSSSPLRYPYEIVDKSTDYLRIGIVKYKPLGKQFVGRTEESPKRGRKTAPQELLGTILLPIPSNVQDNNAVSYSDDRLNGLTAAIASGSTSIMTGLANALVNLDASKAQSTLENAFKTAGAKITTKEAQDLITKQLASSAAGIFGGNVSVNQLLARQGGTILNPNMELLFNGPTLRSFRFSFKMTPRNKKEMEHVKSIIRCFKKNMAPQTNDNNLFLKTPNVFELTYMQGNNKHSFLHNFKQCFLENISVNYTGEGTYATYDDGTPISMIMDLTFKELEPIYNSDYDDEEEGKSGVGY